MNPQKYATCSLSHTGNEPRYLKLLPWYLKLPFLWSPDWTTIFEVIILGGRSLRGEIWDHNSSVRLLFFLENTGKFVPILPPSIHLQAKERVCTPHRRKQSTHQAKGPLHNTNWPDSCMRVQYQKTWEKITSVKSTNLWHFYNGNPNRPTLCTS